MVELEDEGTACLLGFELADPSRLTFPEDAVIELEISYDEICLSGSCTADRHASCTARLSGTTITIATHASWIDLTGTPGAACTDDCQRPTASCPTPPLAAGEYTFRLGIRSLTFSVPTVEAFSPCI
jgi:hypothetical protein